MHQVLYSIAGVKEKINRGERLLLAGDEQALRQLPAGTWIGGTIPYFMAEEGGVSTCDQIYVTELPKEIALVGVQIYDQESILKVYNDLPENGFGFIIIPAFSQIHFAFALQAPKFDNFAIRPLLGWVAGTHMDQLSTVKPKVFDGECLRVYEDRAVMMQVWLPKNITAEIDILNIFEQGEGDTITFPTDAFIVKDAFINGKRCNLADYIRSKDLDTHLPLVANYFGAAINVSFQSVDFDRREVKFYAPVFSGAIYRLARPMHDYITEFTSQVPNDVSNVLFSCNCILNYLYSELEGKRTGEITGPMTFGEVAYQLLNQTMVYLRLTSC